MQRSRSESRPSSGRRSSTPRDGTAVQAGPAEPRGAGGSARKGIASKIGPAPSSARKSDAPRVADKTTKSLSARRASTGTAGSRARAASASRVQEREQAQAMDEVSDFLKRRRAEVAAREKHQTEDSSIPAQSASDGNSPMDVQAHAPPSPVISEEPMVCGRKVSFSPAASLRSSVMQSLEQVSLGRVQISPRAVTQTVQKSVALVKSTERFESIPAAAIVSDEVDDFTREVAACIIQHYWREALQRMRTDAAACASPQGVPSQKPLDLGSLRIFGDGEEAAAKSPAVTHSAKHSQALPPEPRSPLRERTISSPNQSTVAPAPGKESFPSRKADASQHNRQDNVAEDDVLLGTLSGTLNRESLSGLLDLIEQQEIIIDGPELAAEFVPHAEGEQELLAWAKNLVGKKEVYYRDGSAVVVANTSPAEVEEWSRPSTAEKRSDWPEETEKEREGGTGRLADALGSFSSPPRAVTVDCTMGLGFGEPEQCEDEPELAMSGKKASRKSTASLRNSRSAQLRQSAQKLAEIMSFLDQVDGDVGAVWESTDGFVLGAQKKGPMEDIAEMPHSAEEGENGTGDLASSVFDGIKAKMAAMQRQMEEHALSAEKAEREVVKTQAQAQAWVQEAEAQAATQLQKQQQEGKATIARHLEFIDRLLADKDALSSKCTSLANEVQAMETRQQASIKALKEGWAAELKRQKEAWSAAERIKRDSWAEEKTREVKELTIKGLEPEIQRLMAKHKGDMRKLEQRLAEEAQARLDAAAREHEDYVRQLRDRLLKEREDAVEKERVTASDRLRDANERHEMLVQQQRQRLMADADSRIEEVERQRRTERQRLEAALETAREETVRHRDAVSVESAAEKKALQQTHEKALAAAKEQWDAQQEGWRASVAERASQEVAACEKRLRAELLAERDEQIEAVMDKLEDEAVGAKQKLEEMFLEREEQLVEKHRAALREAEAASEKMAAKNRSLLRTQQEADERLSDVQNSVRDLQRELKAKNNTIAWMEGQVNDANDGWERRAKELGDLNSRNQEVYRSQLATKDNERKQISRELAGVQERLREVQARKAEEMEHVESRVKAAIAKKDDAILKLKKELDVVRHELHQTKSVLKAQKQTFCT